VTGRLLFTSATKPVSDTKGRVVHT
jgi:hypothetical protein